ncbi:biosynthetic-type acetolactate synthase large subunit [Desulfosporosinus lacus]|uniref:Acetolactate synthase n=1 Tax=Desulfosporosinus lacus DSM 15449 TaxID=1121420 RepID=A0A1M5V6R9_9FIRM|nr:biosynthetic-type acetolactate synthase large subunit [Desulfosporosinus lacus]SHH70911.1 acetolactate synthase, large subunit [Desulfosporosinus lacus DSM 15449]
MALWGIEEQVKHYFADELEKDVEMTGAQFIVKFLEQKGVAHVYGIPGAAILPFYDAVLEQEHMRSINVRHEQTAIFMADGYARATGKVGICAATSGPGATNFLTGLYSAYGDSVPIIAFTGQVPTNLIGRDAFQEAPIVEMARPVTKAAYLVTKTTDLPKVMSEAWKLATQGRKGPVLIDIPVNVQKGLLKINLEDYMREEKEEYGDLVQVTDSQLEQVFTMIEEAERPVLMVGGGVALGGATKELIDLAQLLQIPVVSSLMGKDGFPNYHRLYAGMVGTMCQTPLGNKTVLESDLILNLGGRFDSRSTGEMNVFKMDRKIIHINIDEKELSRHVPTELAIASDVKNFILKLNNFIRSREYKLNPKALERIEALQIERTRLARQTDFESSPLKPQQAIIEVRKGLRPDAIVTLDCGLSQIWATQLYEAHEPRTFLITGRAGTMGWGLGAAMGAQLAYPQRQVVNLLGDASLGMSLQELATAAKHNIPVVVVVLNNSLFGLIRQQQNLFFNRRWISTELDYTNHIQGHQRGLDFVATAKGMGVEAELVEKPEQITDALARAFSAYRPYLIEILVDPDAQCSVSMDGTISGVREVS